MRSLYLYSLHGRKTYLLTFVFIIMCTSFATCTDAQLQIALTVLPKNWVLTDLLLDKNKLKVGGYLCILKILLQKAMQTTWFKWLKLQV